MSDYRFCPRCASALTALEKGGLMRQCCTVCGFVHWDNPLPVVAALIELDGRMLLARNSAWPDGMFGLVTGFMEQGETAEAAVAREVKEETDLDAADIVLIGVYEFIRKNELIIAYHVVARGEVQLSEELADFKLVAPERLRPWRMGTGLAVADWMIRRGLQPNFIDIPAEGRKDIAA